MPDEYVITRIDSWGKRQYRNEDNTGWTHERKNAFITGNKELAITIRGGLTQRGTQVLSLGEVAERR